MSITQTKTPTPSAPRIHPDADATAHEQVTDTAQHLLDLLNQSVPSDGQVIHHAVEELRAALRTLLSPATAPVKHGPLNPQTTERGVH